ncbi:hypothetical protein L288_18335 [Sphingobium quisquiliarum P25]|uniref:Cupin 2 conserved barrel domain-containing protein n=1 Tax=Sphingobium quisquiliarum P25 TaxID=1329909 RepID=T0G9K6_9SPHN|nr:cupin domain-containing protein [Sphingobium quisquiliarum]EQB00436.1 hypothetical protein L288_18335 [Sphingobium quisquiliarum P25]
MEKKFAILRAGKAPDIIESGIMDVQAPSGGYAPSMQACLDAGLGAGSEAHVVFTGFGLSVVHAWFKRSFPLPLHSHNADCLYYIIGGGLRLGREDLKAGDAFFVPADVPYTYTPGPEGVELIEVRNREGFDYRERSGETFWRKALDTVRENQAAWADARRFIAVDR